MSAAFASFVDSPYIVVAGWTLLVILWETTAVGVLLAAWRTLRPRASAREQYTAAALAFSVALVLAAVTPVVLNVIPARPASAAPGTALSRVAPELSMAAPGIPIVAGEQRPLTGIPLDAIAAAAAVLWMAGVLLLALRLAGGWIFAAAIRHRATRVADKSAHEMARRICDEAGVPVAVELLQSAEVEAPVVIGWRRPALILPADVTAQLSSDMLASLLAHEFAHVTRRDYLANILQSMAELLLFFSPAVTWMSRRIREAREYCCDDVAVARCGDPKPYVQALTLLASLGTVNSARPVMGAAGPRLIVRVRRLLQGESVPGISPVRLVALASGLIVLTVTGVRVTAVSADRASRFAAGTPSQDRIPFGFAMEQDGSGVALRSLVSTSDAPADRATIRNVSTERVTGLRFVAVIERYPTARNPVRFPVRLFISELLPVSIAPGDSADVSPDVVTPEQLQSVAAESGGAHVQIFVGLAAVRYANGFEWSITPNQAAVDAQGALGLGRPEIPRALIARDAAQAIVTGPLCRDERNRPYSPGALVSLRNEPGHFVRCDNGRWVESAAGR